MSRCCRTRFIDAATIIPTAETLYNVDSVLLANRTVDMGGNSLTFQSGGVDQWLLQPNFFGVGAAKLTFGGVIDPIAMQFTPAAVNGVIPINSQGTIWVSDGTDGQVNENLIYRDPSGSLFDLTAGLGNYAEDDLTSTGNRNHTMNAFSINESYLSGPDSLILTKAFSGLTATVTTAAGTSQILTQPASSAVRFNNGVFTSEWEASTNGLALTLGATQELLINGAVGALGDVLTSGGPLGGVSWQAPAAGNDYFTTDLVATGTRTHSLVGFSVVESGTIGANTLTFTRNGNLFNVTLSNPPSLSSLNIAPTQALLSQTDGTDTGSLTIDPNVTLTSADATSAASIVLDDGGVTGAKQVHVQTEAVDTGSPTLAIGQLLTLLDPATGESEWQGFIVAWRAMRQTGEIDVLQTFTVAGSDADAVEGQPIVFGSGTNNENYESVAGIINTGGSQLDIPVDGVYFVFAKLLVYTDNGDGNRTISRMVLDDTTVIDNSVSGGWDGGTERPQNHFLVAIKEFTAGENISFWVSEAGGGNTSLYGASFGLIKLP